MGLTLYFSYDTHGEIMFRKALYVFTVLAVLLSGIAFADWVVTSEGNGAATSGSAASIAVSPGVPSVALFPGASGDVAVSLSNPNDFDVTITSINGNGPVISTDATCQADGHDVTFTNQTGSWVVPANGDLDVTLANAASMGVDAANSCQEVNFLVPLSLAG